MVKVIDVDKLIAWTTANQRDEVIPTLGPTPSPTPSPAPTLGSAPVPSGPLGSKTNPIKVNKLQGYVYVPENCSSPEISIPATSKVYFEVDPNGQSFKFFVGFYSGAGTICKCLQDKITGQFSPEECRGSDSYFDIVLNPSPTKKFLYAIDNSLSPGVANDKMWVSMPFNP
jgi:hypothetical protein